VLFLVEVEKQHFFALAPSIIEMEKQQFSAPALSIFKVKNNCAAR